MPLVNPTPDATTTIKGRVQLAGDLGGTADSPTIPGLAAKLSSAGGTMNGSLSIASLDSVNGTKRLNLQTYEETGAVDNNEVLRIQSMNDTAKGTIAYLDKNGQSKAWLQVHDYLHYYGAISFDAVAVTTATDRVTATSHGLPLLPGWRGQFTTTGSLPGGLSLATNYYAKRIDANTLEFYTDSALVSKVDLTTQGTGTHTFTPDNNFLQQSAQALLYRSYR